LDISGAHAIFFVWLTLKCRMAIAQGLSLCRAGNKYLQRFKLPKVFNRLWVWKPSAGKYNC